MRVASGRIGVRRLTSVVLLATAGLGCGYGFAARRDALPTHGKHVFAPVFSNNTSEAGVEALFTEAFRAELANAHLDGPSDAPVQAKGEVTALGGGPGLPFTAPNATLALNSATGTNLASYTVSLSSCVRLVEGPTTLASTCVSGSEDYQPGLDPLQIEAARRIAIRRLATRLMKQAVDRLSTGF